VEGVPGVPEAGHQLLALYDQALPEVYGYLLDRCGDVTTAEDLTSETFLAAVRSADAALISIPWMIGVARHRLADHWRRRARDDRLVAELAVDPDIDDPMDDPWDARLTSMRAVDVLGRLGDHHRAALTLRYVDALPVPEVAELLGRTVHAAEALAGAGPVGLPPSLRQGGRRWLTRSTPSAGRSPPLDPASTSPSRCGAGSWRSWA
jgi:RNA polymerase sigma-70 factor (ECF subfamily)